jgi:ABC-type branched-subunit amino acid transport system substrate-binding protein
MGCAALLAACSSVVPADQFFGDGRAAAEQGEHASAASAAGAGANGPALPGAAVTGSNTAGGPASGTGGAGGSNGIPAGGGSGGSAVVGVRVGNCAGLQNGHGITDTTITLANAADLSGPVPGLFSSAQQAVNAFAAYFNATSRICGRKLKIIDYDSETSSSGDQQASTAACSSSFAMVGSEGAFDDGGAQTVTQCGIPDIRAVTTSPARTQSPVTFSADGVDPYLVPTAQYDYLRRATGSAYQRSALVYLNAGSSVANAVAYKKAMQQLGYKFVVNDISIDVSAFSYDSYATALASKDVQLVQFEGTALYATRLMRALANQKSHPILVMDSVAYDPTFVADAGGQLNGMYTYVNTALFEEASRSPELQLYETWLHRVAPNAQPSFFGVFAWGAMRLFTQLAAQLGGQLNRGTLLAALRATHAFDSNHLFAPQDVGGKKTSPCESLLQLENNTWVRRSPYPWSCESVLNVR